MIISYNGGTEQTYYIIRLSETCYLSFNFAFRGSGLDIKTEKHETRHAYTMIIEKEHNKLREKIIECEL